MQVLSIIQPVMSYCKLSYNKNSKNTVLVYALIFRTKD